MNIHKLVVNVQKYYENHKKQNIDVTHPGTLLTYNKIIYIKKDEVYESTTKYTKWSSKEGTHKYRLIIKGVLYILEVLKQFPIIINKENEDKGH